MYREKNFILFRTFDFTMKTLIFLELILSVDKRVTLKELKIKIQNEIAVDADMFRVN